MARSHNTSRSRYDLIWVCLALAAGLPSTSWAVPSFARQTGMACAACHTVFPELTPFGREFKLNGYVLDNIKQITGIDTSARQTLAINSLPPISMNVEISYTRTGEPLPDSAIKGALAKDGDLLFPDQVSFFYAGKIADGLGAFIQLTYDGAADHFGLDNTDIRYAHHFSFGGANGNDHDLILGVTLNNNPTVQDVWNTTPAWGYPFASSSTAPGPVTSAKVDNGAGGFGQTVGGLGVYVWLDDHFYIEVTNYDSSIPGGAHPLDSTQADVVNGLAPYWRVAYEQRWDRNSLEVGAFGLDASTHPGAGTPLQGPTDKFKDAAADVQYQFIGENHFFTFLGTYIHESQTLDASVLDGFAANDRNRLNTVKVAGEYYYRRLIGGTVSHFSTNGGSDALLYGQVCAACALPTPVVGSATGSPDARGYVLELDYLPWLNTKLQTQYVGYQKFNGGTTNYDGNGRSASNNNTLFVLVWIAF